MLVIYIWLAVVMGLLALLCYAQYTTEHQVNERIQEMDEFVKMLSQHTHEHFTRVESKIQDIRQRIGRVKDLVQELGDPVLEKDLPRKSKRKESKDTL